jgi:hypothetical protein
MRWISLKSLVCTAAVAMIAGAGILHPATHSRTYPPLLHGADMPADINNIFSRACEDCHSDTTEWPWYSHVPPMSKLIADDVQRGRAFLNLSDWQSYSKGRKLGFLIAMSSAVTTGEMPPSRYTLIHGDARLTDAERQKIAAWAKQETARFTHRN